MSKFPFFNAFQKGQAPGGGSGANLTRTLAASQVTINSDTGTDAIIPAADSTNAGVMTSAMQVKLAAIEAGADVTDAANVGSSIDGATAKTTPVDADSLPLIDSADSNALKKVTWSNIKATLKTYFDTLYQAAGSYLTSGGALGTPSSGTLSSCIGLPVAGITGSTSTALGVGSLEIGHASDSTLARLSAGNLTVEGNLLFRAGGSFVGMPIDLGFACSDETTALTTGEKVAFYAPYAFNLTSVECCVSVAPTSTALTVDVEKPAGTTLLTGVASISVGAFTATGSVSGGTQAIAKGDRLSINIDAAGGVAAGLKVTLIGTRA